MLFTRCPDCQTTFKITADALRKADGQVRCGRCASVFNAYTELRRQTRDAYGDDGVVQRPIAPAEVLATDREAAAQEKHVIEADARRSTGAKPDPEDPAPQTAESEGVDAGEPMLGHADDEDPDFIVSMLADSGVITATLLKTRAAKVGTAPAYEELTLEAVIEELEASADPDEPEPQLIDSPIEVAPSGTAASVDAARPREQSAKPKSRPTEPAPKQARRGTAPIESDARASPTWVILEAEPKGRAPRAWMVGAVAAALLLAVQVTHHFRSQLAATAVVGPWLQEAYAVLGNEIAPRWDLAQYEIVDWTAVAEPNANGQGSLKIAAQVLNRGPRPQPHPHVHVLLKDRWESTVGSRVFSPLEYLPGESAADAWLRAGATARAELDIVDPGPDAYGFELDLCVAADDGALRCAADDVFR
jgi:predicted Zn finger-like uncharacterized protein